MVNYHEKVLQPFSADELDRIAQLKRFCEWVDGDPPANLFVRFRDEPVYRPTDNGFRLVSPNQAHH